jgi:hypothetical protein
MLKRNGRMKARSLEARQFFDSLSPDQWRELLKRLRHFAYKKYGWLLARIRGLNLNEIILDAIEDTYFGTRQWPPEDNRSKKVSMFGFLCQTIRSKVSHRVEEANKMVYIDEISNVERPQGLDQICQIVLRSNDQSDRQAIDNEFARLILESVSSDDTLTRMVKYWVEKPDSKPQEIAADLGIPIEEVRNAQKRIYRIALDARKKWGQ